MNFSLILPSRERPQLLRDFLESVRETADDLSNLEVLICLDNDDETPYGEAMEFGIGFCQWREMDRQEGTTPYYNFLASKARGRFLWMLNDDCLLTTKHWDTLAMDFFWSIGEAFGGNGAFYGHTHDTLGAKDIATDKATFSMFPLLSRRAYEAQGWVLNPKFPTWSADCNLWKIWDRLGRIVDLPMMTVTHVSSHHGLRQRDEVNERCGRLSKHPYPSQEAEEEDVNREVERIRRVLDAPLQALP